MGEDEKGMNKHGVPPPGGHFVPEDHELLQILQSNRYLRYAIIKATCRYSVYGSFASTSAEPCGACEEVAELAESKMAGEGELRPAGGVPRVFDRDGDGYVSAAELRSVLRRLGMEEGARHGDCVRMIAAHDGDGDGRISFQEFRAMMENAA
uniref:EF-hand domain-containing protein n=1 Tax=Oryza nivara TaxID=4536 RepID=A0A0E0GVH6_ORYNI